MGLLKRENWWVWLLICLFSNGIGMTILASLLKIYKTDAWYSKWQNWVLGAVCFIFPFFIMVIIFFIQSTCMVASKLKVPGSEIYLSPYIWILCLIVPILGWIFFSVMMFYLFIMTIIMIYRGNLEACTLS